MPTTKFKKTDFLVIGTGLAGALSALELANLGSVTIISKTTIDETATNWAKGGIASVTLPEDSFEDHINDTLNTGAGLSNPEIVKAIITRAPYIIEKLLALGVNFTRENGQLHLTREGGHSKRRVVHAKDSTGSAIQKTLIENLKSHKNIEILENAQAIDLIVDGGVSKGAYLLETETGEIISVSARATLLATGGAGKVYLYTSNPDSSSGDGLAMAHRAGCRIANLEFMQFHPTCLFHPIQRSFLLTEALRGEGAIVENQNGKAFLKDTLPEAELSPRDVVARAIDFEMKRSGDECAYLNLSSISEKKMHDHFPEVLKVCLSLGIDPLSERIPIVPAAHYMCGGVITDKNGETTIKNLYAAGEVAHTGLHGANRLASNSLMECGYFSLKATEHIQENINELNSMSLDSAPEWEFGSSVHPEEQVDIAHNWDEIRRIMWNYVGIVRSDRRLQRAEVRLQNLKKEIEAYYWSYKPFKNLIELRNLVVVADLIVRCAQMRKESRGLHFNMDYPNQNNEFFLHDSVV